jgi:hypothetical protein
MKKSFILILGGLLFRGQTFSQTADQEAIKKVCLAEVQAYVNFNYDSLASYHVQSANDQLAWNNPDGSYGSESGWKAISNNLKDYFKTGKKENLKLSSENFTFVIKNDMAFASFNWSSQNTEGTTIQIQQYQTLLKINGLWKILAVQAYVNHPSGK